MISYLGDMPIAEAVFRAGEQASRSLSEANPWPLAAGLFSVFGPSAVRGGAFCLSLVIIGLTGFRLGLRSWLVPYAVAIAFLTASRDLGAGALVSGADPLIGLLLWEMLILFTLARPSVISACGLGFTLLAWQNLDLSWTAAFLYSGFVLAGSLVYSRDYSRTLSAGLLIGVLGILFSPSTWAAAESWNESLQAPTDSVIRLLSGWFSPNFQLRKELVLSLFGAALLLRGNRTILSIVYLAAVPVLLLSEFGALLLAMVFPYLIFESGPLLVGEGKRKERMFLLGFLLLLAGAAFSGQKSMPFQRGAWALRPALIEAQVRAKDFGEELILFHDFRMAPQLLAAGLPSFLDARILSGRKEERRVRLEDYNRIAKVADDFREVLSRLRINTILLPSEVPLINVLRELKGFHQAAETQPLPFFFRGSRRESAVVLFLRDG